MCRIAIHDALRAVLTDRPGLAVIHSSIPALQPPEAFSSWDCLHALHRLIQDGWTLAIPSFTLSFCQGRSFSLTSSKSEVGVLADLLLQHFPMASRSRHPIYSFVCIGPDAEAILDCASPTAWGEGSPFAYFEDRSASIVMLGCSWAHNTQFHRYEEEAEVPYRHAKEFIGSVDYGEGPRQASAVMYARHLYADPINDFTPAVERLRGAGLIATSPLWRGTVEAVRARDLARVCRELLKRCPYAFVKNRAEVQECLRKWKESELAPALRVCVLGHTNMSLLENGWLSSLREQLPERRIELHRIPYGQLDRNLADPKSDLYAFSPDIRVFCDRIEDIPGWDRCETDRSVEAVRNYAEKIISFHSSRPGWTIVHRFFAMQPLSDARNSMAMASCVARCNLQMEQTIGSPDQLAWVDAATESSALADASIDPRLWYVGRFPFSNSFSVQLGKRWSGLVAAMLGKAAKVVVVDLDNTLWGGVLGEDGISGLQLGGDYPGNAFLSFQCALKALLDRGIALAVCSKNDEDLAVKALAELPDSVLRPADFSAMRINWSPKWENVASIADELNVGLDAVLFIDDNPLEREGVKRNLPAVKVMDLPSDPALYANALYTHPFLGVVGITDEDRKRIDGFRAAKRRKTQLEQAANLDEYLADLQMKAYLDPLDQGNRMRAAQLCQKTNQFNSTSRRYDAGELERLQENGCDVVVVGLEDRFSARENIGLIVLRPDGHGAGKVDLMLLSCRVLGRGLEMLLPNWAIHRARDRGWTELQGEIVMTERNVPVRKVFADAGFSRREAEQAHEWWIIGADAMPTFPSWIDITDNVLKGAG